MCLVFLSFYVQKFGVRRRVLLRSAFKDNGGEKKNTFSHGSKWSDYILYRNRNVRRSSKTYTRGVRKYCRHILARMIILSYRRGETIRNSIQIHTASEIWVSDHGKSHLPGEMKKKKPVFYFSYYS